MASAQVLSNSAASSRKKDHLEAGKRKLEEFRKNRARKAASTGQLHSNDGSQNEKQPKESDYMRLVDTDGAGTSEKEIVASVGSFGPVENSNSKESSSFGTAVLDLSNGAYVKPPGLANNYGATFSDPLQKPANDQGFEHSSGLGSAGRHFKEDKSGNHGAYTSNQGPTFGDVREQYTTVHQVHGIQDIDRSARQFNYHSFDEAQLKENETSSKGYAIRDPSIPLVDKSVSIPVKSEMSFASSLTSGNTPNLYEDSIHMSTNLKEPVSEGGLYKHGSEDSNGSVSVDMSGSKLSSFISRHSTAESAPWLKAESLSTGFGLGLKNSSDHLPLYSNTYETSTRRSRPSFLDSINVPRASSVSHLPFTDSENDKSFMSKSSKIPSADILASSAQQPFPEAETLGPFSSLRLPDLPSSNAPSMNSISVSNESEVLRQNYKENSIERKHEFSSSKQDEDFAALEQHIEDLTQEKFSLQRALEASRALAESLAVENSSLTDSFNQQGTVVNQLKSDMERLQEEIKTQLLELESIKMDYANAQLECNAADERAKILASEVIGLEEKALRLRSNELKLERQLENSNAEITSYKKKVSSLEKERQDLQSMVDVLQEEKKLLQSKLRKTTASGKSIAVSKIPSVKKDVSTSTEDLVLGENGDTETTPSTFNNEMEDIAFSPSRMFASPSLPGNSQILPPVSPLSIPPDQMRMIENINSLLSELALEKDELMQALAAESSHCSQLKGLNKELSQKLEVQTQRLELLTAQNMANENIPSRQTDPRAMPDSMPLYTDEGDEVVERVLGWIMKLLPGGPSKRRTSKLL
ncbi:PREDICTED: uncharacterized protein LOC104587635 [Nelumbo nucifera]|uniref:Protein BLISTER-like n=2 Tax=Nelumbo nucifera TaxID=4432 RepID=A0A822XMF1_NELNU|nr:PREDICTED: uncharacterized protein LOC104587635 [Nelumbo nucifera]DAD20126.1 TPA_asm: hypothetical protein HUJ06_021589 [Nelumbo nucifera]